MFNDPAAMRTSLRADTPDADSSPFSDAIGDTIGIVFSSIRSLFAEEFGCCAPEEDAATRHEKVDRSLRTRPAFSEDAEEEAGFASVWAAHPSSSTAPPGARGKFPSTFVSVGSPTSSSTCTGEDSKEGSPTANPHSYTSAPSGIGAGAGAASDIGGGSPFGATTVSFGDVIDLDVPVDDGNGLVERAEREVEDGDVLYTGQWLGDKMHGRGTAAWKSGEKYKGRFRDGLPHGQGIFTEVDGNRYDGTWESGEKHGFGVYTHLDGTMYEGQWRHDVKSGIGMERWPDGARYEGQYMDGFKHGKGVFQDYTVEYVGDFVHDMMHGQGTYTFTDGRNYNGNWANGHMSGQGRMEFPTGAIYEGQYEMDMKEGKGTLTWPDGSCYAGQWSKGKQHGTGTSFDSEGNVVDMRWEHGELCESSEHVSGEDKPLEDEELDSPRSTQSRPKSPRSPKIPRSPTTTTTNLASAQPEMRRDPAHEVGGGGGA